MLRAITRAASSTPASGRIVIGSSVIMSRALRAERLAHALLEALQRLEEDDAAQQLDDVREVQVGLLARVITRSASVMMPTQRPPSLTTGRPGSSCSRSVRTTFSIVSSG